MWVVCWKFSSYTAFQLGIWVGGILPFRRNFCNFDPLHYPRSWNSWFVLCVYGKMWAWVSKCSNPSLLQPKDINWATVVTCGFVLRPLKEGSAYVKQLILGRSSLNDGVWRFFSFWRAIANWFCHTTSLHVLLISREKVSDLLFKYYKYYYLVMTY